MKTEEEKIKALLRIGRKSAKPIFNGLDCQEAFLVLSGLLYELVAAIPKEDRQNMIDSLNEVMPPILQDILTDITKQENQ